MFSYLEIVLAQTALAPLIAMAGVVTGMVATTQVYDPLSRIRPVAILAALAIVFVCGALLSGAIAMRGSADGLVALGIIVGLIAAAGMLKSSFFLGRMLGLALSGEAFREILSARERENLQTEGRRALSLADPLLNSTSDDLRLPRLDLIVDAKPAGMVPKLDL